jgi:hypothetical protein
MAGIVDFWVQLLPCVFAASNTGGWCVAAVVCGPHPCPKFWSLCMSNDVKLRRPRLTVEIEPEVRDELVEWALEEGRPVGNLVRRLLAGVVNERRGGNHREQIA